MKQSVKKNYIYNLIYHVLILILPIITAPYISRVLGVENIGIYSYVISISAYFITFGTLGITIYGQREIAYRQKDKKEYSKIFWEILIFKIVTMSISTISFYFIFANGTTYSIYYRILMLELVGNCLDISWFFQGLEEFKKTIKKNIIIKILSVVAIFSLVKTENDLYKYLIIYALSVLIGNISLWTYLPKYIQKVKISELKILRHIKPTINFFIPQIAMQIYTLLDKTMLGNIILDKSEVGFYEQSQKVVRMILTLITSLGTVMLPRIASKFSDGKKDEVENYMKKSINFVFLLAYPMILGIISVSKNFVPIFFGQGYDKVSLIMNVISPIILLIGLNTIIGTQYLLPTKRQSEYTKSIVSGAIVNLFMNFLLIKPYGAIGASIATVIAEFTVLLLEIYFTRKEFNYKKIFLQSSKYIISSIIMFLACTFIKRLINNNLSSTITQVLIGILIYFSSLVILKDEFVLNFIDKIKFMRNELKKKRCHLMVYLNDNLGDDLFVKIISSRYHYIKFVTVSNFNIKVKLDNVIVIKGFTYRIINKIIKLLSDKKITIETLLERKYKRSLMVGGSMFIEGKSSNKALLSHMGGYYIVGINFGPYKTEKYFNECKKIFKNSQYVCFRDRASYNLFKDLGKYIDVAPDLVFNLDTQGIKITNRKRAIFSIIDCKNKLDEKYQEIYDKTMITLTKLLIEKGYEITYMSFCKRQKDEMAIKRIISKCDENLKEKIDTYFYEGDINEALNILGDSSLIIGSRFHANILGLVLGKTIIPVAYSEKTTNVLKDLDFKGKIIDIKQMEKFDLKSITEEDLNYHLDVSKQIEDAKRPLNVIDKIFNYDKYVEELDKSK